MSDREPRKRKKKKDSQKKEDLSTEEVSFSSKKFHEEAQKNTEPEVEEEIVPHEPSFVARIVFFLIFSLLIVATGAVFIALHGADRSVDVINDMEPSHSEEIVLHEVPLPYTETEEWKPEELLKEASEEPQLWTGDIIEDEEIIQPENMQEEETSLPSEETLEIPSEETLETPAEETLETPTEETLETTEYYTQMPFEEISEQTQSEETENFDRGEEANEKEYVENYVDDNPQSYYEDEIEVFPITENSVDYETTVSHEQTESVMSDIDDTQEPSIQTTHEQPAPNVESLVSPEEVESEPLHPPVEENAGAEDHLRTASETVGNSEAESPDNLISQHTTESSDTTHEETTSTADYEHADITNEEDFRIKDELDDIDRIVDKEPGEDDIYFWF